MTANIEAFRLGSMVKRFTADGWKPRTIFGIANVTTRMRIKARRHVSFTLAIAMLMTGFGDFPSNRVAAKAGTQNSASSKEITQNGNFDAGGDSVPQGWFRDDKKTGKKGSVSLDQSRSHSAPASLRLQPNKKNDGGQPLAIAQIISASAYRGRKLRFSGYMLAEGGTMAAIGMLSVVRGKIANLVTLSQSPGGTEFTRQEGVYDVPDDASVQLILTCYVAGQSGSAWFDDVSITPYTEESSDTRGNARPVARRDATPRTRPNNANAGNSSRSENTPDNEGALKASVRVDAGEVVRKIPRTLYGTNVEWIWNGNGMWMENERRAHPEVARLTRDLGVSLIRYPGGLFSDFYHWKDGVGAVGKRRQVKHEAGKDDRSRPNFGTDEALDFARGANAELMITVNAGTGTAQEAADWVRHVNGDSQQVRYWEVGNELYINDGSPTSRSITVTPAAYAARLREFAQAMRAADSSIKVGAIGGENQGRYAFVNYPDWNRTVLEKAGDQIDFLAIHNAYAPGVFNGDGQDLRTVYRAMLAAPVLIKRNLETVDKQIARYAPERASRIKIAVTEWGPLFQFDPRSAYVDHVKTLGSALFAASTLKAFIESPRTEIANFFLLNDMSVLGWIGSKNGEFPPRPDWTPTARYHAFQLFTRHFGEQLVRSDADAPSFDSEAVGIIDAVKDVPYLDIVSSLSADGDRLYVMAINKHFDSSIETTIQLQDFEPGARATAWTLTGTGIDAHTGTTPLRVPGIGWAKQVEDKQDRRFSKGGANEITLTSSEVSQVARQFKYNFPPHSVTSLVLTRRAG